MSDDYAPKVGDMVVRRDRNLGEWGRGPRGLTAYRVEAVSPLGTRVTLRGADGEAVYLTKKNEIRSLRPLTPEDQTEIDADSRWMTARHRAGVLEDWLRTWRDRRRDREAVARFLEISEPLLNLLHQEKTG